MISSLSDRRGGPLRGLVKINVFRIITILLGLGAACVIAEVVLRIQGWPAPGFYVQGRGPVDLRTPGRGGGAFPPSVRGELRHYDYDVECIVNSYGFRDPELPPKKTGEWRIGILGDSFTVGVGVSQAERFGDIFGSALRSQRPEVSVWNLGALNCGTACEAEMLNRVDGDYRLDEIVLAFYGGNDLQDNLDWYTKDSGPIETQPSVSGRVRGWLREHSRLSTFLWVSGIRAWATFQPPGIYAQAELQRDWPDTDRALQHLLDVVGSKKLTILYLPAVPEWNDVVWQQMRSRYHVDDEGRDAVKRAVADWSHRHGVEFVDATVWLRGCESLGACVFPVDAHWNARGHALVAQGLLRAEKRLGSN